MFAIGPKSVPKMLRKGVVKYLRGLGILCACVLGATSAVPLHAAVSAFGLSDNQPHQNTAAVVDRLLPFSVNDSDWQLPERVSVVDPVASPTEVQSLVFSPEDGWLQSDEFNTVARHRGFRKFFLLVFVCGAIIRFFTSPTFITFIRDALDPKAW